MRSIFIAAVAFLAACNQKPANSTASLATDWSLENLKGKVKQVKSQTFIVDSVTGKTGALDQKTEEDFDDKGFAASYTESDSKDSMVTKQEFSHNGNGTFKGQTTTVNGKPKSSLQLEWDKNGKCTMARTYDSTGKQDSYFTDIVLNKFGQPTSAKNYHMDKTPKMSFTNDYDSLHYIGGNSKDSVGKTTYSAKITLDDKKNQARREEMTTDKGVTKNTVTTYIYDGWDNQGNWTQQTVFSDKGKKIKIIKRVVEYLP
ncbi:MAG: hypothetical protein ACR2KZ_08680 [Segetibacter sp.]